MFKSSTQKIIALSVTEAELVAAVSCAQDMLFVHKIVTSMELQVELPMVLELDNSGAKDLANNWSVGGRTRHVDVKYFFLRDLKENGTMKFVHIAGSENESDIFTKNVEAPDLHRHVVKMCGSDTCFESLKNGSSE
jgi:hypothetical protein